MVIICPALCISGCTQGSSELSYRQVAACDYRVPEGIDRHSVSSLVRTRTTTSNYMLEHPMLSCRQVDYSKNHQDRNKLLQAFYAHWLSQRDRVNSYNRHGAVLVYLVCVVFFFRLPLFAVKAAHAR